MRFVFLLLILLASTVCAEQMVAFVDNGTAVEVLEVSSTKMEAMSVNGTLVEVVPNQIYYLGDTFYDSQYAHNITQARLAHASATGDSSVVIAIIDSGANISHPDLKSNLWNNTAETTGTPGVDDDGNGYIDDFYGWNTVDDSNDVTDSYGHGTHVAGVAAATGNNSEGVAGACPNCSLMILKAGGATLFTSDISEAIYYAINNSADVISMSFGAYGSCTLSTPIAAAFAADILMVASAGNDNIATPSYPAACESVISVASTDSSDQRSSFSNYGSTVDVAAPGSSILSTVLWGTAGSCLDNNFNGIDGYGLCSGTSMSAPYISGVLGLYLSLYGTLNHSEALNRFDLTGDNISADQSIGLRVNTLEFLSNNVNTNNATCIIPSLGVWNVDSDSCENTSMSVDIVVSDELNLTNVTLNTTMLSYGVLRLVNSTINGIVFSNGTVIFENGSISWLNVSGNYNFSYLNVTNLSGVGELVVNDTSFAYLDVSGNLTLYNISANSSVLGNVTQDGGLYNTSSFRDRVVLSNIVIDNVSLVNANVSITNATLSTLRIINSTVVFVNVSLDRNNITQLNSTVSFDAPFINVSALQNVSKLELFVSINTSKPLSSINYTIENITYPLDNFTNNFTGNISISNYGNLTIVFDYADLIGTTNTTTLSVFANLSIGVFNDSDGDGINDSDDTIFGNASLISSDESVSLLINGSSLVNISYNTTQVVNISSGTTDISFSHNFSTVLNTSNMFIRDFTQNVTRLVLGGFGEGKTVVFSVANVTNFTSLCIHDRVVQSSSELSDNCTGTNDTYISFSNVGTYNATYLNATHVQVSGVQNTGITQMCTENWTTGDWSSCVSNQQTRTITDQNNCGTFITAPATTQSCSSGGGGGGGSGGSSSSSGGGSFSPSSVAYPPLDLSSGAKGSVRFRQYYNITFADESRVMIFYLDGTAVSARELGDLTYYNFTGGRLEYNDWVFNVFVVGATTGTLTLTQNIQPLSAPVVEQNVSIENETVFRVHNDSQEQINDTPQVQDAIPAQESSYWTILLGAIVSMAIVSLVVWHIFFREKVKWF